MNRRSLLLTLCCCSVIEVISGCGGNSRERYLPASTSARSAVQTALDTWKSGAAYGPITTSKPTINVFDARWREGKKLESFQIVEEIKNAEQPQFKVTLKLAGEPAESSTYLVIGIDPLQVFRDVDYKQAQSM